MRRLDDGLTAMAAPGPVRIRVAGDSAWIGLLVVPVLAGHELELDHVELPSLEIGDALRRGVVDVALVETITPCAELEIERLGELKRAVCAMSKRAPSAFAVRIDADDAWPAELHRNVALRARRLEPLIEACRSGAMCAVLPVAIARAYKLHILREPRLSGSQLYLTRRAPLGPHPVDPLLDAIRQRARDVLA